MKRPPPLMMIPTSRLMALFVLICATSASCRDEVKQPDEESRQSYQSDNMLTQRLALALLVLVTVLAIQRCYQALSCRLQELPYVKRAVMLFDGKCVMCNGFVDFCIARKPSCPLKVAGLESEVGLWLCKAHGVQLPPSSFVYIEEMAASPRTVARCRVSQKSDAALRSLSALSSSRGWMMMMLFEPLPTAVRDFVYDLGWRYRRVLFGTTVCQRRPGYELEPASVREHRS